MIIYLILISFIEGKITVDLEERNCFLRLKVHSDSKKPIEKIGYESKIVTHFKNRLGGVVVDIPHYVRHITLVINGQELHEETNLIKKYLKKIFNNHLF